LFHHGEHRYAENTGEKRGEQQGNRKNGSIKPNPALPEFVDCHCSEIELYKRATDMGYSPLLE
jgi:hypothetical protein